MPTMLQALCEALKTQEGVNPDILPETGHPLHREATGTVQGDTGPMTRLMATSWQTH